jgi:hypothetical protein
MISLLVLNIQGQPSSYPQPPHRTPLAQGGIICYGPKSCVLFLISREFVFEKWFLCALL